MIVQRLQDIAPTTAGDVYKVWLFTSLCQHAGQHLLQYLTTPADAGPPGAIEVGSVHEPTEEKAARGLVFVNVVQRSP